MTDNSEPAEPSSREATAPRTASLLVVATVAPTIRQFLVPYAIHLRDLGWRVDAAANGAKGEPVLQEAFDTLYELPLSRSILDVRGMFRGYRAISAILDEVRPDMVHVHTPIAAFVTRLAVRRMPLARRPMVAYTAHGFHFYKGGSPVTNATFVTAERIAGRWTDRLVVMNDEDENGARRHRIVAPRRLIHMPGIGLDTSYYARAALADGAFDTARRNRLEPGAPLLVAVGELSRRKRMADVISAFALVQDPKARLVIAGEGFERPRLEDLIRELGLGDRVTLAGKVADVRPLVASATGLILASDREGLRGRSWRVSPSRSLSSRPTRAATASSWARTAGSSSASAMWRHWPATWTGSSTTRPRRRRWASAGARGWWSGTTSRHSSRSTTTCTVACSRNALPTRRARPSRSDVPWR